MTDAEHIAEQDALRDERDHWIGEAKRYERLYKSTSDDATMWWRAKKAAEAERNRARTLAVALEQEVAALTAAVEGLADEWAEVAQRSALTPQERWENAGTRACGLALRAAVEQGRREAGL